MSLYFVNCDGTGPLIVASQSPNLSILDFLPFCIQKVPYFPVLHNNDLPGIQCSITCMNNDNDIKENMSKQLKLAVLRTFLIA